MATFSFDVQIPPASVNVLDVAAGYGTFRVPLTGLLTGDLVVQMRLAITPAGGSTTELTITPQALASGQITAGSDGTSASGSFSLDPTTVALIAAAKSVYSVRVWVTRAGVTKDREVQAGGLTARVASVSRSLNTVTTVTLSPSTATVAPGATQQLAAVAKDAGGNVVAGQVFAWVSSNPSVATVDANGLVTVIAVGIAIVSATVQGVSGLATVTGSSPAFAAPSTGQVPTFRGGAWIPENPDTRYYTQGQVDAAVAAEATARTAAVTAASFVASLNGIRAAVATRGNVYNNGLSDGVATGGNYRSKHVAPQACTDLSLVYGNFQISSSAAGESDGPNDITVRAAIEYPVGTANAYPVYFNGSRDALLKPGAQMECSVAGMDIPAGATFYVRTYVTVASAGMKWPVGMWMNGSASEGALTSSSPTDLTTSGSIGVVGGFAYSPLAILGKPYPNRQAVVAMVGDSIQNSTNASVVGYGFVVLAINDTLPHIQLAQGGDKAAAFLGTLRKQRMQLVRYATHGVVEYGVNDLNNRTLAQIQGDLLDIWTALRNHGLKVWQTTITPHTTSTDAWATTGNQTAFSAAFNFGNSSTRAQLNDWIRDGAPLDATTKVAVATGTVSNTIRAGTAAHPLTSYFETSDTVETARNSGIWKAPGYTADGLHPTQTGHLAMSAVVNTALFTLP